MKWQRLADIQEPGGYFYFEGGFHVPQYMLLMRCDGIYFTAMTGNPASAAGIYFGPIPLVPSELAEGLE